MAFSDVLAALAYAGAGAGIGSIGAAIITSRSGKGEARAHAADLITNAAGNLAERLDKINTHLEQENQALRTAVLHLTTALDRMLPVLVGPPEVIESIRMANNAAKLAI